MKAVDMLRVQALLDCLKRARYHLDFLDSWLDDSNAPELTATIDAALDDIDSVLGDDALLLMTTGKVSAA